MMSNIIINITLNNLWNIYLYDASPAYHHIHVDVRIIISQYSTENARDH